MFKYKLFKKGEVIFSAKTIDGKSLKSNKYLIGNKDGLIIEIIGEESDSQCIVEADASNIYYNIEEKDFLQDINKISSSKVSAKYIEIDFDTTYFVYPGNYAKEFLPDVLEKNSKVKGIFLVNCDNINDNEKLLSDVLGSIYYEEN